MNLHLTRAQKCELVHYREGDVLVFHQRDYGIGVEAGDACHVIGTEGERVLLDLSDGHVRRMRPDRRIRYRFELYETRSIELRAGDRIRWTRPHRGTGLALDNGARATVRDDRPPAGALPGRRGGGVRAGTDRSAAPSP